MAMIIPTRKKLSPPGRDQYPTLVKEVDASKTIGACLTPGCGKETNLRFSFCARCWRGVRDKYPDSFWRETGTGIQAAKELAAELIKKLPNPMKIMQEYPPLLENLMGRLLAGV